jgi:hypothetical protein
MLIELVAYHYQEVTSAVLEATMEGMEKLSMLRVDHCGDGRLTRVNSINVLDEGLRIGGIGRQINSKVKSVKQGVYRK